MLKPGSYGDSIILSSLAYFWDVKITVLRADFMREVRFRHNSPMEKADIILVYNGRNHYCPACEYSSVVMYHYYTARLLCRMARLHTKAWLDCVSVACDSDIRQLQVEGPRRSNTFNHYPAHPRYAEQASQPTQKDPTPQKKKKKPAAAAGSAAAAAGTHKHRLNTIFVARLLAV